MISQKELKELFKYDADTGIFTRLTSTHGGRWKAGTKAGSKHSAGYTQLKIGDNVYLIHRLAWLYVHGEFPQETLDHINGDKRDNRICNLRLATYRENNCNVPVVKGKLLPKGVVRVGSKYRATIYHNYKQIHLGYFTSSDLAEKAYTSAADGYQGDFAHHKSQDESSSTILKWSKPTWVEVPRPKTVSLGW